MMTAAITIDPRTLPLTDEDTHTLSKLIAQYNAHLNRNTTRSNYFEGKHKLRRLGLTLPPSAPRPRHHRRMAYTSRHYTRTTPRPGWIRPRRAGGDGYDVG